MSKYSKFFKVHSLTQKVRDMEIGDTILLEVKDEISFNDGMKTVSSLASRVGFNIKQEAFKAVPNTGTTLIRVVRLQRLG